MGSEKSHDAKVLLVDDSADFIRAAKVLLRDFNIEFASGGAEALEKIREDPPDVVLVDLVMPKMTGLELMKIIKEEYPQIIMAALTAIDEEDTLSECFELGVTDYLIKGAISSEKLRGTIEKLIKEAKA